METLIIYGTKSGASAECAKLLTESIVGAKMIDIERAQPELAKFERVIVGAGVRNDKMYKSIRDYLQKNQAELLSKELACFLCQAKPQTTEAVIVASIPEAIRQTALAIMSFGGYKANWVPVSSEHKLKGIDQGKIAEFVGKLS
ncbi:hypothetical protein I6N95_13825 [Vagococcus sp. BWB3-3]|uniref:Flavodoxin domain-containing protein n=1 Tax=Vagococcus allomyrinae TaxID=2794353 RepID=A0A940P5Q8_9ENTE|nr:flavodoxin domain-containing protein [Vagococcus allomyrinae]MBP1042094.1 hypothetical protein [Vagococcus allomyrinae]